jgi:hypothetical protein
MSYTLYDAFKHSRDAYQTAFLRQIATSDESFAMIPFIPMGRESFSYEREKSTGSFGFIAPGGSVSATTGTSERIPVATREATADFYVDNFAEDNMSEIMSPLERSTMQKLKAAGRTLADKFITGGSITGATVDPFDLGAYVDALVAASPYISNRMGPGELKYTHAGTLLQFRAPGDVDFGTAVTASGDGNYTLYSSSPSKWITVTLDVSDATVNQTKRVEFTTSSNEFDGLKNHCAPSQLVVSAGTDGDALSFGKLEELRDLVKNRDGRLAYIMPASLRRKYNALVRATNGAPPAYVLNEHVSVPSFDGIPILTNDWIPVNEAKGAASTLSSVYLVNFATGGDLSGVFMGCLGGESHNVEGDPRDTTVLGFRLRELGQKEGNSQVGRRLSWYGALGCGSDLSLARSSQLITV